MADLTKAQLDRLRPYRSWGYYTTASLTLLSAPTRRLVRRGLLKFEVKRGRRALVITEAGRVALRSTGDTEETQR